jgi:hypothetical protein
MTVESISVALTLLDDVWEKISSVPNLLILIGAITTSAFIVSVLGRVIHHMNRDDTEEMIPRSNRDRRSGDYFSPPYKSNAGMVLIDRRSGGERRTMAH